MKNKLRLLLLEECNRNCEGCCNKQWDLQSLPVCTDFSGYDEIMLTGGEPMLRPNLIKRIAVDISEQNPKARIILYTACVVQLSNVIPYIDGITLTLHEEKDYDTFLAFDSNIRIHESFSLRLNVFAEVGKTTEFIRNQMSNKWVIKNDIEWIENCPLPTDEIFMRIL